MFHKLSLVNVGKRLFNFLFPFVDKQGDIYALRISEDCLTISNLKKVMGHTSFISDYVSYIFLIR